MTPLEARSALLDMGEGRPYLNAERQRSFILARLARGPARRSELEAECGAASATKRLSELRRQGWPITTTWTTRRPLGGFAAVEAVYSLEPCKELAAQLSLNLEEDTD